MASYNLMPPETIKERASTLVAKLENCDICPRCCSINRLEDEHGFCNSGRNPKVASYSPHFGEEPPLVGMHGSGTIFMTGCNLACVFCQNFEISQLNKGTEVSSGDFANMMIRLQKMGCHNINFVTPTHLVPQIIEAVIDAKEMGLAVPLVYNSGGYDSVETLQLLDGIFDIYMPDAKYGSDEAALKYSNVPDYTKHMNAAILEMHRQVGDLAVENGIATRGLLVRHLVLPEDLAGTAEVIRFLAEEVSRDTYLNVMAQYHPMHKAHKYEELARPITLMEYSIALKLAMDAGLTRGLAIY